MDKIVSVVIKAHNKCELFAYGLESLKKQDYNNTDFEVVLVDDASTDGLKEMVLRQKLSFQLKYICVPKNVGRSVASNIGSRAAEGDIIILTDADCIFPPDFITNHVKYHKSEKTVVSGAANFYPIYTYYYHKFNKVDKNIISILAQNNQEIRNSLKINLKDRHDNIDFPIASIDDISNGNFTKYSYRQWKGLFNSITKEYGIEVEDFHGKWMSFIGLYSFSFKKKDIIEIGMFEDRFLEYGLEDWELGYRFYKAGYTFLCPGDVYDYHQEHPRNNDNIYHGNITNYKIFREKFSDMQIYLFALSLVDWKEWNTEPLGKLYSEIEIYNKQDYPNKKIILSIIQEIAVTVSDIVVSSFEEIDAATVYKKLKKEIFKTWDKTKLDLAFKEFKKITTYSKSNEFSHISKLLSKVFL